MKKLKPDELDKELINGKNLSMLPEMKIEFEGKFFCFLLPEF